jgi:SAM-dependent methyltransferase
MKLHLPAFFRSRTNGKQAFPKEAKAGVVLDFLCRTYGTRGVDRNGYKRKLQRLAAISYFQKLDLSKTADMGKRADKTDELMRLGERLEQLREKLKKSKEISGGISVEHEKDLEEYNLLCGKAQAYLNNVKDRERVKISDIREDLSNLAGKKVLDLGCGAGKGTGFTYPPYFCRAAYSIGMDVVGVDILPNKGERFKAYKLDLTHSNWHRHFEPLSFDIVNVDHFGGPRDSAEDVNSQMSPALWEMLGCSSENHMRFVDRLIEDTGKLLKDGGFLFYETEAYVKSNERMRPVGAGISYDRNKLGVYTHTDEGGRFLLTHIEVAPEYLALQRSEPVF